MEPDVKKFLSVIVQTMSMTVLWMLLNTVFGIKMGLLFLDEKITIWHGVYYLCLIASFIWLVLYIRKKWKEVPSFNLEQDDRR
jgi:Ca2+/Na+ antiporter